MKKISGPAFLIKWLLPALFIAFLGLLQIIFYITAEGGPLIFLLGTALFIFLCYKGGLWSLADSVYDNGNELIFRKKNKEQRVNLRDISNVSYSGHTSPQRIEIHTRTEGATGKKVLSFIPPLRIISSRKNHPLVLELIERVDRARNS